jgi:GntR family transcriptional regulator
MILHLEPSDPLPLYLQLVEQVKRLVALGALRPGDRLPSVRELAVQGRVNRNTAARAVQALEAAGIVRTRVGQGTFVTEGAASLSKAERDAALDDALDRVVIEAASLGAALDRLSERLSRRIRLFRQERSSARANADRSDKEKAS